MASHVVKLGRNLVAISTIHRLARPAVISRRAFSEAEKPNEVENGTIAK